MLESLMREVLPQLLWLGHAGDGRDLRRVLDANVKAVVQVAMEEPPLQLTRDLIYCRFPLVDGEGNPPALLEAAVQTTAGLLRQCVPTLVCCSAGLSRSPIVAAAALAVTHHQDPDECLKTIVAPQHSDVSPLLWQQVKKLATLRK